MMDDDLLADDGKFKDDLEDDLDEEALLGSSDEDVLDVNYDDTLLDDIAESQDTKPRFASHTRAEEEDVPVVKTRPKIERDNFPPEVAETLPQESRRKSVLKDQRQKENLISIQLLPAKRIKEELTSEPEELPSNASALLDDDDSEEENIEDDHRERFRSERSNIITLTPARKRSGIPDSLESVFNSEEASKVQAFLESQQKRRQHFRPKGRQKFIERPKPKDVIPNVSQGPRKILINPHFRRANQDTSSIAGAILRSIEKPVAPVSIPTTYSSVSAPTTYSSVSAPTTYNYPQVNQTIPGTVPVQHTNTEQYSVPVLGTHQNYPQVSQCTPQYNVVQSNVHPSSSVDYMSTQYMTSQGTYSHAVAPLVSPVETVSHIAPTPNQVPSAWGPSPNLVPIQTLTHVPPPGYISSGTDQSLQPTYSNPVPTVNMQAPVNQTMSSTSPVQSQFHPGYSWNPPVSQFQTSPVTYSTSVQAPVQQKYSQAFQPTSQSAQYPYQKPHVTTSQIHTSRSGQQTHNSVVTMKRTIKRSSIFPLNMQNAKQPFLEENKRKVLTTFPRKVNSNIKEIPLVETLPMQIKVIKKVVVSTIADEEKKTQELRKKIEEQKRLREQILKRKEERRRLMAQMRNQEKQQVPAEISDEPVQVSAKPKVNVAVPQISQSVAKVSVIATTQAKGAVQNVTKPAVKEVVDVHQRIGIKKTTIPSKRIVLKPRVPLGQQNQATVMKTKLIALGKSAGRTVVSAVPTSTVASKLFKSTAIVSASKVATRKSSTKSTELNTVSLIQKKPAVATNKVITAPSKAPALSIKQRLRFVNPKRGLAVRLVRKAQFMGAPRFPHAFQFRMKTQQQRQANNAGSFSVNFFQGRRFPPPPMSVKGNMNPPVSELQKFRFSVPPPILRQQQAPMRQPPPSLLQVPPPFRNLPPPSFRQPPPSHLQQMQPPPPIRHPLPFQQSSSPPFQQPPPSLQRPPPYFPQQPFFRQPPPMSVRHPPPRPPSPRFGHLLPTPRMQRPYMEHNHPGRGGPMNGGMPRGFFMPQSRLQQPPSPRFPHGFQRFQNNQGIRPVHQRIGFRPRYMPASVRWKKSPSPVSKTVAKSVKKPEEQKQQQIPANKETSKPKVEVKVEVKPPVGETNKSKDSTFGADIPKTKIVHVCNLSSSTTENALRKLATSIGPVQEIKLEKTKREAMITFTSPTHALNFQMKFQRYMLDLAMIQVSLKPS